MTGSGARPVETGLQERALDHVQPAAEGAAFRLAAPGVLSAVAYAVGWTYPGWIFSHSPEQETLTILDTLGHDTSGIWSYIAAVGVPFLLYGLALAAALRLRSDRALAVGIAGAVGLPLVLLFAYPSLAADVFDYMMAGRIIIEHGENPYVTVASQYRGDVFFPPIGWPNHPSVYGPVFLAIMGVPTALAGDNVTASLIMTKLIMIASHGVTTWLVYLTVKQLAPERAVLAVVAYGWNPLTVIFFGVDGHNDALMLMFLAAAVYASIRDRHDFALPLLTLSVLVKFAPAVLFPIFILAGLRSFFRLAIGVQVSILLTLAFFFPFWAGMDTLDGARQLGTMFTSSPAALLREVMPEQAARGLLMATFGIGYLLTLLLVKDVVNRSLAVMTLYLVTISFWLKGWYITWPLMLAAMAGGWPLAVVIGWSTGPFIVTLFGGWGWERNWLDWQERWGRWMMEVWLTASLLLPLATGALAALCIGLANGRLRNPFRSPETPTP
jgi:hypothetical protein